MLIKENLLGKPIKNEYFIFTNCQIQCRPLQIDREWGVESQTVSHRLTIISQVSERCILDLINTSQVSEQQVLKWQNTIGNTSIPVTCNETWNPFGRSFASYLDHGPGLGVGRTYDVLWRTSTSVSRLVHLSVEIRTCVLARGPEQYKRVGLIIVCSCVLAIVALNNTNELVYSLCVHVLLLVALNSTNELVYSLRVLASGPEQ